MVKLEEWDVHVKHLKYGVMSIVKNVNDGSDVLPFEKLLSQRMK